MIKKIVCLSLCFALCLSLFTGCNFIEHNDEKDMRQISAKVDRVVDSKGDKTYDSGNRFVYKEDLAIEWSRSGQSYLQQYGDAEKAVNAILDQLVLRQLLVIEAERLVALGDMEWSLTEENRVRKVVYEAIDSQLLSINKDILGQHNKPIPSDPSSEDKETTYPVYTPPKTEQELEEEENKKDTEEWLPEKSYWPGMNTSDPFEKSLQEQTMDRFTELLKKRVKDDFKATADDRAKFAEDDKKFAEIKSNDGFEYIYPHLWKSHYVEFILGKSAREQVLIESLQKWIEKQDPATADEIQDAFNKDLSTQKDNYKDESAYKTAVKDAKTTLLYTPNDDYFFVKHILLPFTEAEQATLKDMRAQTALNSTAYPKSKVDTYRAGLVNGIVAYPHVNGEDDKKNPMTAQSVFNEVYSAMVRVSASPYEAERKFDELIYKYNTDPGIFDNARGYAVKRDLEKGDSDGYMEEFTAGATKLDKEYRVGDVLPEYVVTDYGVHIMYYSGTTKTNAEAAIMDYQTAGEYSTYYRLYKDKVSSKKAEEAFKKWQAGTLAQYEKHNVHKFAKTYKNLWED